MTRTDTWRGVWAAAALMLVVAVTPVPASIAGPAATTSVTLGWTAPGDDGNSGTASEYDLRYSTTPITPGNFDQSTVVPGLSHPAPAGTHEQARVGGLEPGRLYYFALKAVDEDGNWSLLSNVAFKTTPGDARPTPVSSVSLSPPFPSPARQGVRIDMMLPSEMVAHVTVHDIGGRVVKWLAGGSYPAGRTVLQWDLTDDTGEHLSAGQYWVLGVLGDVRFTHRLTVVP